MSAPYMSAFNKSAAFTLLALNAVKTISTKVNRSDKKCLIRKIL